MRWLADENFSGPVFYGLLRKRPEMDIVRVQDAGLDGWTDSALLTWAAEKRVFILTHDVSTMTDEANQRLRRGERLHGVFAMPQSVSIAKLIEEILTIEECSKPEEWEGQVVYLPF